MKKVFAAILLALTLSSCTTAGDVANNKEAFSETWVGDTRCIVFKPYSSSGEGTQMDCDFYAERD